LREAVWQCRFTPAQDWEGHDIPGVAVVRHTWRLEDAAPDPWVPLRAAVAAGGGQSAWATTDDLASVVFTSPSGASPAQRVTILRHMRNAAGENAACSSIENVAAGPAPKAWDVPATVESKDGKRVPVVGERWTATQCGRPMAYALFMRFPDEEAANFTMIPLTDDMDAKSAAPEPAASQANRIAWAIRSHIEFTPGKSNPVAEVELKVAPDGRITGARVSKRSGNPAWDRAVLAAVGKTARLPLDEQGKVPPVVVLTLRPL
jgi:TonB family protein